MKRKIFTFCSHTIIVALMLAGISTASNAQVQFTKVLDGPIATATDDTWGAVWADFNNDGFDDLFTCNDDTGETNRFFWNNGDGTFTRDTLILPATDMTTALGATSGDYDNDGFCDLYVANTANGGNPSFNVLYHNEGDGTFTKVTNDPIVDDAGWSISASWVDYDNDGWLDMFVANFDGPNNLYKNNGDGTFTKITEGDIVTEAGTSYGGFWADYDNDGFQDLYVTNNFGSALPPEKDFLYHNNGDGTFTKITEGDIVNDTLLSHGVSWGDYDNDGDVDLFVACHDWYVDKVNHFYENNGDGTFTSRTDLAICQDSTTSLGSTWGDINNDGWLDLIVASARSSERNNLIYLNDQQGDFTLMVEDPVYLDWQKSSSVVFADYDNDGYSDLYSGTQSGTKDDALFHNNGGTNNWIAFRLQGTVSNQSAIGAKILLTASGMTMIREISGATGLYSQGSKTLIIGLGVATTIDEIIIKWPSGAEQIVTDYQINAYNAIVEGGDENQGKILGFIRDAETNLTIDEATVLATNKNLEAQTYQTPFGSHYSMMIPEGTYDITCQASGYEPLSLSNVEILENQNFAHNFYLQPQRLFTGIDQTGAIAKMSPNPARELLRIEANAFIQQVIILNQSGQMVVDHKPANSKTNINTSHLAPGVYIVKIATELGITQQKLIIN